MSKTKTRLRNVQQPPVKFEDLPYATQVTCKYFVLARKHGFFIHRDGGEGKRPWDGVERVSSGLQTQARLLEPATSSLRQAVSVIREMQK